VVIYTKKPQVLLDDNVNDLHFKTIEYHSEDWVLSNSFVPDMFYFKELDRLKLKMRQKFGMDYDPNKPKLKHIIDTRIKFLEKQNIDDPLVISLKRKDVATSWVLKKKHNTLYLYRTIPILFGEKGMAMYNSDWDCHIFVNCNE
jgi:hypothetical protein